jgi:enamine deaminase RidA (YjgF/YER057c/UK114 family)
MARRNSSELADPRQHLARRLDLLPEVFNEQVAREEGTSPGKAAAWPSAAIGNPVRAERICRDDRAYLPDSKGATVTGAITLIRSASLSDVAEYAYAATAPAESRLIFLAGSCPLNEDGSTAAIGDYPGQAAKAVENMQIALAESGAALQDVISTRVLVASTRKQDLVAAWEIVRDCFGDHDVPSTLLGVTVLGYDDQLVEIEAVAAVLDS